MVAFEQGRSSERNARSAPLLLRFPQGGGKTPVEKNNGALEFRRAAVPFVRGPLLFFLLPPLPLPFSFSLFISNSQCFRVSLRLRRFTPKFESLERRFSSTMITRYSAICIIRGGCNSLQFGQLSAYIIYFLGRRNWRECCPRCWYSVNILFWYFFVRITWLAKFRSSFSVLNFHIVYTRGFFISFGERWGNRSRKIYAFSFNCLPGVHDASLFIEWFRDNRLIAVASDK